MRPKYYDFEGYGFDEFMVISRARREKDRAEMRRANRKAFAARHKENWDDDDWDDEDYDDFDDDFDDDDDDDESASSFSRFRR
jgi:hypothetical protein